jgi:peptidoglycan/xylan/chitin deacetylase (PgdA/CDA1 family)
MLKNGLHKCHQKEESTMKFLLASIMYLTVSLAYGSIEIDYSPMDFSKVNLGNIHQGENEIILTFDDGPNSGVTNKVLDLLADFNIKANFFVIGENVKAHPDIMRRMVDEGHIVGNHSMTHLALQKLDPLSWKDIVKHEVMDAHDVIAPYMTNNTHFYFRAPYAAWAQPYADFLNESEIGKQYIGPILWDIGGELELKNGKYLQAADWECWSKKVSVNDCLSGYLYEIEKRRGGVVLMHDLRHQSLELLTKLIPALEDRGYTFKTLNDVTWKN